MIDALVGLLESLGGEVRCGAPVERVAVEGGRAVGVVVQGGERLSADRAVIANLTPTVLFGGLVDEGSVPAAFMRKVRAYRYGPATMMIHLAMSDLPAWAASDRAREHAYVHIGPYLDDMSLAYLQAVSGYLPPRPTLVVGQPTAVDPTRAPDGKHVLWVQVRMVPSTIRGDAAGEIEATTWDEAKELFADRVMALIEGYAPGMASRVLGRHVMSPDDLERYNSNLVGGDSLGGSHHLMQHFLLRPFPGWTRYRTPVPGLYMCGAGTWPGAGLGAGSGYLLGKALTRSGGLGARLRRRPPPAA